MLVKLTSVLEMKIFVQEESFEQMNFFTTSLLNYFNFFLKFSFFEQGDGPVL